MTARLRRAIEQAARCSVLLPLPRCRRCGARLTWGLFGGLLRPCRCSTTTIQPVDVANQFTSWGR